jgi:seryl-tRNA synthetase
MSYLKIENAPDLVKDTKSGAVLNTNTNALAAYRKQRARAQKVESLESKINKLEKDISELKALLTARN